MIRTHAAAEEDGSSSEHEGSVDDSDSDSEV